MIPWMSASDTRLPILLIFSSTVLMSSALRISMAFCSSFSAFCASPRFGAFSGWPRSTSRLLMVCSACSSPHLLPAERKNLSAFSADLVPSARSPMAFSISAIMRHMLPWPMLSPRPAKMSAAAFAAFIALWGWFSMACVCATISRRSTSPRRLPEVFTAVSSLLAACSPAFGLSCMMCACTTTSKDFTMPLVLFRSRKMPMASVAVLSPCETFSNLSWALATVFIAVASPFLFPMSLYNDAAFSAAWTTSSGVDLSASSVSCMW
mmetsp:Transcript_127541/g.397137  ORF Transcript_127541/g.397137 Transcript_127541/m.397137 type:complete len:265 (-) Transcript_127541:566-1360(-)